MDSQTAGIVVGYDGSQHSAEALEWAAKQADWRGIPLTVMHVVDFTALTPGPIAAEAGPALNQEVSTVVAQEGVERARKVAGTVKVTGLARLGQVAATLINASQQAELLVVGNRGYGDIAGTIIGSVAFMVSAHAHCPVVVVRGNSGQLPGPRHQIVVGVDDSECSGVALRYAAGMAAKSAAALVVVSSYRLSVMETWTEILVDATSEIITSEQSQARQAAQIVNSAAVESVSYLYPELEVSGRVLEGPPAAVLCQAALGAGLLVVGSRGRGGFTGLLLGSVSHKTLHLAPCPVAVLRVPPA